MIIIFHYTPVNVLMLLNFFDRVNFNFLTGNHQKHHPSKSNFALCSICICICVPVDSSACVCVCVCCVCVCNVCICVCSFAYVILLLVDHSAREEQVTVAESTYVRSYRY